MCKCNGHYPIRSKVNNTQHKKQVLSFVGKVAVTVGIGIIGQVLNGTLASIDFQSSQSKDPKKDVTLPDGDKTKPNEEVVQENDTPKANKEAVQKILTQNNIELSEEDLNEVVNKYATMKEFDCGRRSLEQRVVDYANGLNNYQKAVIGFVENKQDTAYNISGVEEAKAEKDLEKYKNAYLKAADEYIELHDDGQGDGRISHAEFVAKETADAGIDIEALSDDELAIKGANEIIIFKALDTDNSGFLEKDEVAGILNYTATQDGDGKNITFNDNKAFGEQLENYAHTVLSLNETDNKEFTKLMQDGKRIEALKLLKEKSGIEATEFDKIANMFKNYEEITSEFIIQ